ncbi:hypothetical protein [Streptomyces clavuligerus]|uniref:hypothetical protein n=1 Tax=Streptomyces clavuligerus TaxID=1901 RepID=UPI0004922406|nr:hypothetical protein [Streptomyces clavuligerus]ANW17551.1 hypothetical protein BB341_04575 [Streptomyces clavuligerus]AXU12096.1 hypothetical protein D1794_04750 [Streptomyces clavuligerus]MBY6301960.1 hypothetical protein [Streptomyces clavuligerus]QCS04877.1 hypothetical protein CRV15_04175 [Streptomyces clavuligerus]QPJ96874.1 hypothetical protein GE265_23725 [Streptomyces clavuligerus]
MGLFRRRPKRDGQDAPRDPEFPYLSADEGARFRSLVREAFAEQGLEVTVYADVVADSAGRRFGLTNLATLLHHDDRGSRCWPELVRHHVGTVLRTMAEPSALDTLSVEQIRSQLYPRVVGEDGFDPGKFGYARPVAPGLHEILALDLPESVMMLTDDALQPLGDLRYLREQALYNLRGLPIEGHETVRGDGGTRFDVVLGESFYTASRVLTLGSVVRETTGAELTPDGALVAVPFRHQLAFHAIRDATVVPALNAMAAFAAAGYTDAPGAISPCVYWWREGRMTRLSDRDEAGQGLRITVDEEFQAVLERLVGDV